MTVVVIIEGIILLEHITKLNLKLRFASNMYQICSMHVQVLSASPAVKGIPVQHFPNLPRNRIVIIVCLAYFQVYGAKGQLQPGFFYQAGSLVLLVT